MEIIDTINFAIVSFNCLLGAAILIAVIVLMSKIRKISPDIRNVTDGIDEITIRTKKLNEAKLKIDYTKKNSLPLFGKIISGIIVLKLISKEYKKSGSIPGAIGKAIARSGAGGMLGAVTKATKNLMRA